MSVTPRDFSRAVLDALSLPASENNLVSMTAWQKLEGGHWSNAAKHNPLNTMLSMPGSWDAIGNGVRGYPDWATGVAATAKTLGQSNMQSIVRALRASAPPSQTMWTIGSDSPWGGSDYTQNLIVFQHDDAYWKRSADAFDQAHVDPSETLSRSYRSLIPVAVFGLLALGVGAYLFQDELSKIRFPRLT